MDDKIDLLPKYVKQNYTSCRQSVDKFVTLTHGTTKASFNIIRQFVTNK